MGKQSLWSGKGVNQNFLAREKHYPTLLSWELSGAEQVRMPTQRTLPRSGTNGLFSRMLFSVIQQQPSIATKPVQTRLNPNREGFTTCAPAILHLSSLRRREVHRLITQARRCQRKFLCLFPGGFQDETYLAWESSCNHLSGCRDRANTMGSGLTAAQANHWINTGCAARRDVTRNERYDAQQQGN